VKVKLQNYFRSDGVSDRSAEVRGKISSERRRKQLFEERENEIQWLSE